MKKCVVIGSNSFSGQDYVDYLLDETDYKVIGTSRSEEKEKIFLKYKENKNIERFKYKRFDLNNDINSFLDFLDSEKPEYIVNFAAQSEVAPSWEHPEHWFQTNTVSLSLMVNHLRKQTYLEKYLHVSSPEAYGSCSGNVTEENTPDNPSTPYAASKAAADMIVSVYQKQYGFPAVFVRSTNVYGARQQLFKIIPKTIISILSGKKIQLHGGGVAVKSYIQIRDISRGELDILHNGKIGDRYHLSPTQGVAVKDVVKAICDKLGKKFEDCVEIVAERPGQDAAYVIDSTKAQTELGWKPEISLEQGIEESVQWVKGNWDEIQKHSIDYHHKA